MPMLLDMWHDFGPPAPCRYCFQNAGLILMAAPFSSYKCSTLCVNCIKELPQRDRSGMWGTIRIPFHWGDDIRDRIRRHIIAAVPTIQQTSRWTSITGITSCSSTSAITYSFGYNYLAAGDH